MSLLEFPIRRYQFTLVAFLMLIALGWFTFSSIPREEDPSFKLPGFQIAAILPGADPKDLERLVAKPIEDRLAELDDVHDMETVISDGVSFTVIEFEASTDPDKKYDEVTREVNALRPTLPAELRELTIRKISPALVNIVQYALVSEDAPYRELEDLARNLKDTLKAVPGIRTAESWAFPPRELRVELDLKRMAELGLAAGQVIQAVQSENAEVPAGVIDMGPRSFSLKTSGAYADLDQVRDTVVSSVDGRSVRIRDVAEVRWDEGQWGHIGRYNGKRAVFVSANMKEGFNILEVRRSLDGAVGRFEGALPKRIALEQGFDQSANVASRLNRLYIDFGDRHRAGDAHPAAARLARGRHRDGVDPAVAGLRHHRALLPRLLDEPAVDRRLRGRARPAGRRLDRRGREHRPPPAHGLHAACRPRSPARSRSSSPCSAAPRR